MQSDGTKSKLSIFKINELIELKDPKFRSKVRIFLVFALYVVFTVLFYGQAAKHAEGKYFSDLPVHMDMSIRGGSYSFLYFIMGLICKLPFRNLAIALFESSIVVLTFLLAEKHIRKHFDVGDGWPMWIAAGSLFLCSIYIPRLYHYYYKWTLITQPWHNITYFGMRLFSLPVFFYTLNILESYRSRFTWKDWLSLAIPLLLSASIKPNFLAGYSFALLCVLIVDFVRDFFRKELSIPSFLRYIYLGSVVFPAVIILFYQMHILYGGEAASQNGIEFVFLSSQFFSQGMIKAVIGLIRDIAFPVLMIAYGYKHFGKKEKFIFLLFVITLVQRIILQETGLRAEHMNFTWGVYNGAYLLFLYMVSKFIQVARMVSWGQKDLKDKLFALAGSGLLCAHLFFGLKYFLILFCGKYFYI